MLNPPHPGSVLRECLGKIPMSSAATRLYITPVDLARVLNGQSCVTAELARHLGEMLGTSSELWMNMQSRYDLWHVNGETIS
jgi:addiction module HigA family antidote